MLLRELVDAHVAAQNLERPIGRELSQRTVNHLIECVNVFERWLDRPATVDDFRPNSLNAFISAIVAQGRSPYTAHNRRTGLLVLWRCAERMGLVGPALGVREVYLPDQRIDGFDLDQMRALLASAEGLRGTVRYTGIPQCLYWPAALRVKWALGLRSGDLLKVAVPNFDSEASMLWVFEHKTGKAGWHVLQPRTAQSLRECIAAGARRELVWPGLRPRSFWRAFRKLVSAAGLPGGTSRWVRRGSASTVDYVTPGQGWRLLNHSDPKLFERNYRVVRIAQPSRPAPPEL